MPSFDRKNKMEYQKNRIRIRFLTVAAFCAALYVALTYLAFWMGLDKGVIQLRFSEALCVLVAFTPAAVPGLTVGCILANILTGAHVLDIVFGSLATLIGALVGRALVRFVKRPWQSVWVTIPTVLANAAIVPLLLRFAYGAEDAYLFLVFTVSAGEILSASLLGTLLYFALHKRAEQIFGAKKQK